MINYVKKKTYDRTELKLETLVLIVTHALTKTFGENLLQERVKKLVKVLLKHEGFSIYLQHGIDKTY